MTDGPILRLCTTFVRPVRGRRFEALLQDCSLQNVLRKDDASRNIELIQGDERLKWDPWLVFFKGSFSRFPL